MDIVIGVGIGIGIGINMNMDISIDIEIGAGAGWTDILGARYRVAERKTATPAGGGKYVVVIVVGRILTHNFCDDFIMFIMVSRQNGRVVVGVELLLPSRDGGRDQATAMAPQRRAPRPSRRRRR